MDFSAYLFASLAVLALGAPRVDAAIFFVTTLEGDGEGSFKRALEDANAAPGDDLVLFAAELRGVIDIADGGLPAVTESVEIIGPGVDRRAGDA
ncbi:MAG: hypothetical protein AAGF23_06230, partial [Acidobacteriota bacterium]